MEREATRAEVLEKMGQAGAAERECLNIAPRSAAGKMHEDKAPAGSVRIVADRAGATASAVSLKD
jgi:hypothetical protein